MASSRSIAGPNAPGAPDGLDSAVLDGAFEIIDEVEDLLTGVAEGAPPDLVEPALVALSTRSSGLRRFPPDVSATSAGWTRSGGAPSATPASRPSTSSMVSKASSSTAESSPSTSPGAFDPTMERDDAACDALPCNVL